MNTLKMPIRSFKKMKRYIFMSHHQIQSLSSLSMWDMELNNNMKLKIEKHWRDKILNRNKQNNKNDMFYVLPMFPYPSGNLHMGHVRVYSISDTMARFQRLCGKNVIHPIGWDAFGLPAENAAIQHKIPPNTWTESNIQSMKHQLLQLAFDFDWQREISTCDPNYYKWTQYIFLKLFEQGLAYQKKDTVNWDPIDKTVLADEQVDDEGCSWRSGAKVEKKILTQWFIKTSAFASKLYDGLSNEILEDWQDIINLQKHWIGECNGVVVDMKLKVNNDFRQLSVWTSEPYRFYHGEFLTIKADSILAKELKNELDNRMVKVINPLNCKEIPIFVSENANYPDGRDEYLACPKFDLKDKDLAKKLDYQSSHFNCNINFDEENERAINEAKAKKCGGYKVSSKLKDWLISRQRYWGTPIPIIHCDNCGKVPVKCEDLPVLLPRLESKTGVIESLKTLDSWVNCRCPKCDSNARRETDTMDTFVDSSWYYYRFLDPYNKLVPFSKEKTESATPVHLYIGGKEHAVLHLYYARFVSYFLHSIGMTSEPEPFRKLIVQGMVMGQSFRIKSSGKYIPASDIKKEGKSYKTVSTGEAVVARWEKMSKSKYNGENPERLLSEYGCDTTRLFILADVPPVTSRKWSEATFPGVLNWQRRIWMTMSEFLKHRHNEDLYKSKIGDENIKDIDMKLADIRNFNIASTTYHFRHTSKLSVGISRLQSLTNGLRNKIVTPAIVANSAEFELSLATLLIMLSPVTPHFCSELWAGLQSAPHRVNRTESRIMWDKDVLEQKWPKVDHDYGLSFQCKVDGNDVCDMKITLSELQELTEEKAIQMVSNEKQFMKRTTRGIERVKFENYPDCRAILNVFTTPKIKVDNVSKENSKIKVSN